MTAVELEIVGKPPEERTMKERHLHALMRMRIFPENMKYKSKTRPPPPIVSTVTTVNNSTTTTTAKTTTITTTGGAQVVEDNNNDDSNLKKRRKKTKGASITTTTTAGAATNTSTKKTGTKEDAKLVISCDQDDDPKVSTPPPPSIRYQTLVLTLPKPVGGHVEVHPDGYGGLACLDDGSLVLYRFPEDAFFEQQSSTTASKGSGREGGVESATVAVTAAAKRREKPPDGTTSEASEEGKQKGSLVYLVPPPIIHQLGSSKDGRNYFVTCATFGKHGKEIFAATKCGNILGFRISSELNEVLVNPSAFLSEERLSTSEQSNLTTLSSAANHVSFLEPVRVKCDLITPSFEIKTGVKTIQIISSRNGKMILVNSTDNTLRLYDTDECWKLAKKKDSIDNEKSTTDQTIALTSQNRIALKPRFTFQDVVSKARWTSCDFSGDGEFVVGGCNSKEAGDKYELYLWNTGNGALLDQLTGPQVALYSLSWHPTRSFIAVGTSDGLVDIWGPRMDWTAFAPDFQALQKNVEYIEREDEFDSVVDGDEEEEVKKKELTDRIEEQEIVDVVSVEKVPAFDSDSEDESAVFYFDTKISGLMHSSGG